MENTTPTKQVSFIQYSQPQLDDGSYEISVTQTVSSTSGAVPTTAYEQTRLFAVTGERYTLNPKDVVSVFPPAFSLGEFSNVLPHVVLNRTTMPWERSPGGDSAKNDAPWLGILLFLESDPVPKPSENTTLLDLLSVNSQTFYTDPNTGNHLAGLMPENIYFPPFPENTNLAILDYGENWTDPCTFIDLPVTLFNNIAPTINDLSWLAHVREVSITNKSETYIKMLRANDNIIGGTTQVAEVIGNRFALPGTKCTAHLVCLENFGPVLPGANGQSNIPVQVPAIDTVRIVSLKSWTYSAISEEYTFAGLLMNINNPSQGSPLNTLQITFKPLGGAGDAAVQNALNMGYAAFNHTTRLGDSTVSWYHGPFVPFNVQETVPFPGNTADEFTRYNPDSGMFDTSYSAAWQLGRMLGLQSNAFATAIYNWKKTLTLDAIKKAEQDFLNMSYQAAVQLLAETLSNYVDPFSGTPNAEPVQKSLTGPSIKAVSKNKQGRLDAVRQVMADPEKIKSLLLINANDVPPPEIPFVVANFIANLKLLYGIPFNYLVPDERMLPLESLRFFYMDSAWVDTLIEGAMSIGSSTAGDANIQKAVSEYVHSTANADAATIRPKLFATADAIANDEPITPIANPTGFLLRSQVVAGWPGFEVHGFDVNGAPLDILRFTQLSDNIMLCLFNGVVQSVKIQEHPEALHFGVDMDINDPSPAKFQKSFRFITQFQSGGTTYQPGQQVPGSIVAPIPVQPYYRDSSSVLQVDSMATGVQTAINPVYTGNFTSAEFALEMIEGVQQVTFNFKTT